MCRMAADLQKQSKSGAMGIRTPGLLHTMQVRQPASLGVNGAYLQIQCTDVPISA